MTSGGYGPVLREVGRLLEGGGTASGLGEGALLRRFAEGGDPAAFEALVGRHGPMVLGTCRRILGDRDAVDDAFQATFLVLARKAGSIRDGDRLGPWLHGVARRVATRSRAQAARRNAREKPGAEDRAVAEVDPTDGLELRAALDEELARLPEKYRAPLVLCYLEGRTHDEAALHLKWPVGTVRSRLARGRDRLRSKLTRRGLSPSAALPAILPASAVPEFLISSTVRVATVAGSAPAGVASLAKGALTAMFWHKLKVVGAVGLAASLAVGGAGALAQQGGQKGQAPAGTPRGGDPILDIVQERDRNKSETDAINRALELVRFQSKFRIEELEAQLAALKARGEELERRWRELAAKQVGTPEARGPIQPPEAAPKKKEAVPEARPQILEVGQGVILIISGSHDRATVLDTRTGDRKTCRLAGTLTEIIPIVGPHLMALDLKGPDIRQVAVFDTRAREWLSMPLREPANGEVSPVVGPSEVAYTVGPIVYQFFGAPARKWRVVEGGTTSPGRFSPRGGTPEGLNMMALAFRGRDLRQIAVTEIDTGRAFPQDLREPATADLYPAVIGDAIAYQAGRFVYAFSLATKKWSVLELKGATPVLADLQGDRLLIPDGPLIHLFDGRTGEWTHVDTDDDKE